MAILGWFAERLRFAPMVERMDKVIDGKHIVISTSTRYTTFAIDGIELMFLRENGEYDGYGEPAKGYVRQ